MGERREAGETEARTPAPSKEYSAFSTRALPWIPSAGILRPREAWGVWTSERGARWRGETLGTFPRAAPETSSSKAWRGEGLLKAREDPEASLSA